MRFSYRSRLALRQVFEDFEDEFAFGEDNDPGSEEDEHEVGAEADVVLIPHLIALGCLMIIFSH